MLLKEGPVNASTIHSQKGAGPVSLLAQGVLGIVVFPPKVNRIQMMRMVLAMFVLLLFTGHFADLHGLSIYIG